MSSILKRTNWISVSTLLLVVSLWVVYLYREGKDVPVLVFNIQDVFDQFDMKKELKADYDKSILRIEKSIDSLEAYINTQMSAGGMSDESYKASAQELYTYNQKRTELESSLLAETDAKIQAQLLSYVREFGKERSAKTLIAYNNDYPVIYADSLVNVTSEVITYVNKKYSGK